MLIALSRGHLETSPFLVSKITTRWHCCFKMDFFWRRVEAPLLSLAHLHPYFVNICIMHVDWPRVSVHLLSCQFSNIKNGDSNKTYLVLL